MIRQQGPRLRTMSSSNPQHEVPHGEFSRPGPGTDLTPQLRTLLDGKTLEAEAASDAFEAMMSGEVHHGEMGALLALLASRGPSRDELLGAARVMRRHVSPITSRTPAENILDTAGTGGAPKTFNVSTAAAIVAAGAGAVVAKHGNRSRTGRGSAEVLQGLGVNVDADPDIQAKCLDEARICFCFAIHHHPATKHVMPVRKALGVPTIFNLLGPLTNPAGAGRQLMGVYDGDFLDVVGEVFIELGTRHAMVLHSEDGLDECSLSAPTSVVHVRNGTLDRIVITPEQAGLESAPREAVTARDLDHAIEMVRGVLDGSLQGPPMDMTLLNAAAALLVSDLCESIEEGVELARSTVQQGAAMQTLDELSRISASG